MQWLVSNLLLVLITLRLLVTLPSLMSRCLGVDQYLAIVEPLHYHALVTKPRLAAVCALVWVLGCLAATVSGAVVRCSW